MRALWFPLTVLLIVGLWAYTRFGPPVVPPMPAKVTDAEERELYHSPGGLYTVADIEANGRLTASEAYPGFRATHDTNPRPGDRLCPVTRTKADPGCTWVIGGLAYSFCCPPCIDEFVRLAKTDPDQVRPPGEYVQPTTP